MGAERVCCRSNMAWDALGELRVLCNVALLAALVAFKQVQYWFAPERVKTDWETR